ncbi:MAG: HAD family hydrolase [Deltaproteobacteria bacterium]|nr:HAD family hydrolase [Deltaproteobacteria bacterium]
MRLSHVVLDFDGTCTRVEATQELYLQHYKELLAASAGEDFAAGWDEGWALVQARSPEAAWTTLGRAPAAPANADPYIAAGEIVGWLERRWRASGRELPPIPKDLYKRAYASAEAPWRDEVVPTLEALVALGPRVTFVSNSATATIAHRLDALLADRPDLRSRIRVFGDANKYVVKELSWDGEPLPEALEAQFGALPAAAAGIEGLRRPVYLRRGDYFHALCKVWDDDPGAAAETIVCGDIYELDLAMPAALGCHVHLVTRAAPHATCDYELGAVAALGARGGVSDDLHALVARVRAVALMAHV